MYLDDPSAFDLDGARGRHDAEGPGEVEVLRGVDHEHVAVLLGQLAEAGREEAACGAGGSEEVDEARASLGDGCADVAGQGRQGLALHALGADADEHVQPDHEGDEGGEDDEECDGEGSHDDRVGARGGGKGSGGGSSGRTGVSRLPAGGKGLPPGRRRRKMSRPHAPATLAMRTMPARPSPEPPPVASSRGQGSVAVLHRVAADDQILLDGLLAGDDHAVASLCDRYGWQVRGVLTRTLGSTLDVEDLMQETFLTIVRKCSTLRDRKAFRPFVVSVAIRVARNELRKRALRRFIGLDVAPELPVTPPHDPAARQAVDRVYEVLSRMDADTRVAFVARHVEGFELTEAAEICGCSLATIKRRLAKAEKCFEAMSRGDPVLSKLLNAEGRRGP